MKQGHWIAKGRKRAVGCFRKGKEDESELSCAELLRLNQQHLLVNQQMAIAGQYLYKWLMREPIYSNDAIVDTEFMVMRSETIQ